MCDSANTGCFFSRSAKENGRSVPDLTASPGRVPPGPMPQGNMQHRTGIKEPVLIQGDFRKVSGISSEIFRQIEAVENDHDPSTAAALDSVERRGEMIVRVLEPRCIGGRQSVEAAQKFIQRSDTRHSVQLVEIVKRPGQTLGLYIREGNGADRTDGVFISRIALESAVYNSGCLRVGDEILAVNLVDVTRMSLDDVVIIMSIPRRLVLAIRQRRGGRGANSPGPPPLSRQEHKPPPVVVIKRDLRDEDLEDADRMTGARRPPRERRTGDGREMTESRSRLGLGLTNYSPQSEQLELYYNSRPAAETPNWSYKPPPPPPSVITEQPKGGHFQASSNYYQNAGTLESLAEKVHPFYPGKILFNIQIQENNHIFYAGPARRLSGSNVPLSQSHQRFPRSGSDQHLPRVEYIDYNSLNRQAMLRSSLKQAQPTIGGTLGRYGRFEPQRTTKYAPPSQSLTRRPRGTIDYSSDTEATVGSRPNLYYYNRPGVGPAMPQPRGTPSGLIGGPDFARFNSLPRDRPGARLNLRTRLGDRLSDDSDGNLSAPEYSLPLRGRERGNRQQLTGLAKLLNDPNLADLRSRLTASPSIFTSDEYKAWLRRAPSSSAIVEQMRASRDLLNQQRAHRFSCSAENIHDALKNTEHLYSQRAALTGTLDRHQLGQRAMSSLPVRSLSSQHIGGPNSIRSPSVRRIRQLLELGGPGSPISLGGHQSPAPTPSTTLPRQQQRQIDINPAEFSKYKLDRPVADGVGISGMLWIHLLAGRGLRAFQEGTQPTPAQPQIRDLYCVLECDRVHKARTVVRSGDLQFDWDESFELDLVSNKQLDVLVYSWDPQHRHKLCYRGAISLTTILKQAPIHQLALKVEPRGTIYLRIRHTDTVQLYKRRGLPTLRSSAPPALFGVDLETVVTREAKGAPGVAPVPIILRRCVEEIERRGLDIIGLYRLCGSATKKRLLREAFERNSRAVELSPEHVPDINVITGVLKDYLRELPEPLFTKCLFQMTVDALGVCLPDDPEGNAKLMLSILDCLPRANRATLVFLLDHLSLVVSASERNKMSAQALATALGPPLMLHSLNAQPGEEVDHSQPIAVLKYLLQIWPQPQTSTVSGRRGEPVGMRGNKANVLLAGKQSMPNLLITPLVLQQSASSHSIGPHQGLVTPNRSPSSQQHMANIRPQFPSAVGRSVQSPRVSQPVVRQHPQLAVSVGLGERGQSPQRQHVIQSPSSSSSSSGSASGSGTDTVKRGVSPTASLSSDATTKNQSYDNIRDTTTKQITGNREIPPKPYARSSSQFTGNNEGSQSQHETSSNGRNKEARGNVSRGNGTGYTITSVDTVLSPPSYISKNGLQPGSASSHSSPSSSTSPSSIHSFKENLRVSSTTSAAAAATSPSSISSSSTVGISGNGKYGTGYTQKLLSEQADNEYRNGSNNMKDPLEDIPRTSSVNLYENSGKIKSRLDDSLSQSYTTSTTTNSSFRNNLDNNKISSPSKTILDTTNSSLSYTSLTLGRVSNNLNKGNNGSNLYTSNQSDNIVTSSSNNKYDFKSTISGTTTTTNELLKTNNTSSYTSSSSSGFSSYSFAGTSSYSSSPYTTSSSSSLGIYSTLPKSANSFVFSTPDYQISFSPNASGTQSSVQPMINKVESPPYTATNPFLNPFLNPPSDDSNGDQSNNGSSSQRKHQLDEDDLK
uniref:CSON014720 protein n=1 Tax=Culicoides sonorensis TaxID=179676 RepID=A0A336MBG0_CULSO